MATHCLHLLRSSSRPALVWLPASFDSHWMELLCRVGVITPVATGLLVPSASFRRSGIFWLLPSSRQQCLLKDSLRKSSSASHWFPTPRFSRSLSSLEFLVGTFLATVGSTVSSDPSHSFLVQDEHRGHCLIPFETSSWIAGSHPFSWGPVPVLRSYLVATPSRFWV